MSDGFMDFLFPFPPPRVWQPEPRDGPLLFTDTLYAPDDTTMATMLLKAMGIRVLPAKRSWLDRLKNLFSGGTENV